MRAQPALDASIAGELAVVKLTERHFARSEVRSSLGLPPPAPPSPSPSPNPNPNQMRASLGLPPLAPPNEFLCPVTQEGQHAQECPCSSQTIRPACLPAYAYARPPWPQPLCSRFVAVVRRAATVSGACLHSPASFLHPTSTHPWIHRPHIPAYPWATQEVLHVPVVATLTLTLTLTLTRR